MKELWIVGREDRRKLCGEVSRGQELGRPVEQIPLGKHRSQRAEDEMPVVAVPSPSEIHLSNQPSSESSCSLVSGRSDDCYRQVRAFPDWPTLWLFLPPPSAQTSGLSISTLALDCCLPCRGTVSSGYPVLPSEILRSRRGEQCSQMTSKVFTERLCSLLS